MNNWIINGRSLQPNLSALPLEKKALRLYSADCQLFPSIATLESRFGGGSDGGREARNFQCNVQMKFVSIKRFQLINSR